MTVTTTIISFAHRGEEIKRLCRKNDKENLARTIAIVREILNNEQLPMGERCYEIEKIVTGAYW